MDPVTGYLIDSAVGKVVGRVVSVFRSNVIEPWASRKAQRFFEEFCRQVATGDLDEDELSDRIDQILGDKANSELLYNAYQSVCLSRSKDLGPRLIAMLTAAIIHERRTANPEEECLFLVAEALYDDELRQFCRFYDENFPCAENRNRPRLSTVNHDGTVLLIPWTSRRMNPQSFVGTTVQTGPLCLATQLGVWAEKLRGPGVITVQVEESIAGTESMEQGARSIQSKVVINRAGWRLRHLMRALGAT